MKKQNNDKNKTSLQTISKEELEKRRIDCYKYVL